MMSNPKIESNGKDELKITLDNFDHEFFITKDQWQTVLNFCQINKITPSYYMDEFMVWEFES